MDVYIEQQLDQKKAQEDKEAESKDAPTPALAMKRINIKKLEA